MELRASERSSSGSQTMNQGSQKRIAIHSLVYLQLLQMAASIKSGPRLCRSSSDDALSAPGGRVHMKASINRVKPVDGQPLLS